MKNIPDHPVIEQMERYGYLLDDDIEEEDYFSEADLDLAYEMRREAELFGEV